MGSFCTLNLTSLEEDKLFIGLVAEKHIESFFDIYITLTLNREQQCQT